MLRFWIANAPEHKIKAFWQEKTAQFFDKSKTNLQHIPYIVTYLANHFVYRKNFSSFLADVISRKIIDFNETLDLDFSFENKDRILM